MISTTYVAASCWLFLALCPTLVVADGSSYHVSATRLAQGPPFFHGVGSSIGDFNYNPAVVPLADGGSALAVRLQCGSKSGPDCPYDPEVSVVGFAKQVGTTPLAFSAITNKSIILSPNVTSGLASERCGTEDPRVTYDADSRTYFLTYTCWDCVNYNLCMATCTGDPSDPGCWRRHGRLFKNDATKSGSLLIMPQPPHFMLYGVGQVLLAKTSDLRNFEQMPKPLIPGRPGHFDPHVETGPLPLRLKDGNFLFIFNGICTPGDAGCTPLSKLNTTVQYAPGWAVLDGKDPTRVLARGDAPLLVPTEPWEVGSGNWTWEKTKGVVFAEGWQRLTDEDDSFLLFYGAADTVVGAAIVNVTRTVHHPVPGDLKTTRGRSPTRGSSVLHVEVDNTVPRRDTLGDIINAHDGHIIRVDDTFFWVGTAYPPCLMSTVGKGAWQPDYNGCGFGNHNYAIYSSKDLTVWQLESPSAIPADQRPVGIYFRPKLLHNPRTGKFVLWFNYVDLKKPVSSPSQGVYGVATADRPQGPYTIVAMNLTMGNGRYLNGDFNVFTDDDGKAYIIYHSYDWDNPPTPVTHRSMAVDLLTDDFTGSVGPSATSGNFGPYEHDTEAPVMFRHGTIYYALLSGINVFAPGVTTPVTVYTSSSPLGPWQRRDVVTSDVAGKPGLGQQSFVLRLNSSTWLWGSDRWGSAPKVNSSRWGGRSPSDGLKSQDFVAWAPLTISASAPGNSSIQPIHWVDTWSFDFQLEQKDVAASGPKETQSVLV